MTGDDKTEAFASWLRDQGIELTAGERSLIAGFVALAGRRPVRAADIAQGIELARGAAISEDARLERLGSQLLVFEASVATSSAADVATGVIAPIVAAPAVVAAVAAAPAAAAPTAAAPVAAAPIATVPVAVAPAAAAPVAPAPIATVPAAVAPAAATPVPATPVAATPVAAAPSAAAPVAAAAIATAPSAAAPVAAAPIVSAPAVVVPTAAAPAAAASAVLAPVATEQSAAAIASHIAAELEPAAPLKISIRTTAQVPVARPVAVAPVGAPRPVRAAPRWPRTRTRKLATIGAALAAAAAAGAFYLGSAAPPPHPAPAPPPAPASHVLPVAGAPAAHVAAQRLRRIALGVRLPDGWREASDAELGAVAAQRDATVVFRGATPADPEHGVFIAAAAAQGGDLIVAARSAERGMIRQLGIDASAYEPAGCALVELAGGPVARCRGIAEPAAGPVAVEIYVRAVGARTIVALSLAKPWQTTAGADAAAIVASFTP